MRKTPAHRSQVLLFLNAFWNSIYYPLSRKLKNASLVINQLTFYFAPCRPGFTENINYKSSV